MSLSNLKYKMLKFLIEHFFYIYDFWRNPITINSAESYVKKMEDKYDLKMLKSRNYFVWLILIVFTLCVYCFIFIWIFFCVYTFLLFFPFSKSIIFDKLYILLAFYLSIPTSFKLVIFLIKYLLIRFSL